MAIRRLAHGARTTQNPGWFRLLFACTSRQISGFVFSAFVDKHGTKTPKWPCCPFDKSVDANKSSVGFSKRNIMKHGYSGILQCLMEVGTEQILRVVSSSYWEPSRQSTMKGSWFVCKSSDGWGSNWLTDWPLLQPWTTKWIVSQATGNLTHIYA